MACRPEPGQLDAQLAHRRDQIGDPLALLQAAEGAHELHVIIAGECLPHLGTVEVGGRQAPLGHVEDDAHAPTGNPEGACVDVGRLR
jgi:hypothetical protein